MERGGSRGRGRGILAQQVLADSSAKCQAAERTPRPPTNLGCGNSVVSDERIKLWIIQELARKQNGIWVRFLAKLFQEEFKTTAPEDLSAKVKSWADIITTESLAGGDIVKLIKGKEELVRPKETPRDNRENKADDQMPCPKPSSCTESDVLNSLKARRTSLPEVGSIFDVHVQWVTHPGDFCITPCKLKTGLDEMAIGMNTHFSSESEPPPAPDTPGELHAVQLGDTWYRGVVLGPKQQDNMVDVYLPDCLFTTSVDMNNVKLLPAQFQTLPICAFRALLHGAKPYDGEEWSQEAIDKFRVIADCRDFVALVMDRTGDSVGVRLIDTAAAADFVVDEMMEELKFLTLM